MDWPRGREGQDNMRQVQNMGPGSLTTYNKTKTDLTNKSGSLTATENQRQDKNQGNPSNPASPVHFLLLQVYLCFK